MQASLERSEKIALTHVVTHPVRYGISEELLKDNRLFINELSKRLNLDRKTVAFHLMTMEKYGLVKTYLETKTPKKRNPVVVRYAELTDLGKEIMNRCKF